MTDATKTKLRASIAANGGRRGARNGHWKGGRRMIHDGRTVVYAPGHPNARLYGGDFILRYRKVATEQLGRALHEDEVVHHINGNPTDDRPENLSVMKQSEHARCHLEGRRDLVTGQFVKKPDDVSHS